MELEHKPIIFVCGRNRRGKIDLIRALTDDNVVPPSEATEDRRYQKGFWKYEPDVATFVVVESIVEGMDVGDYIEILKHVVSESVESAKRPFCFWLCVDSLGDGTGGVDRQIFELYGEKVLLAVMRSQDISKNLFCRAGVAVSKDRVVVVSSATKAGLERLVSGTKTLLVKALDGKDVFKFEDGWESYFSPRKNMWQKTCKSTIDRLICWAVIRGLVIACCSMSGWSFLLQGANNAYMIARIGLVNGDTVGKNRTVIVAGCGLGMLVDWLLAHFTSSWLYVVGTSLVTYVIGETFRVVFCDSKEASF